MNFEYIKVPANKNIEYLNLDYFLVDFVNIFLDDKFNIYQKLKYKIELLKI